MFMHSITMEIIALYESTHIHVLQYQFVSVLCSDTWGIGYYDVLFALMVY